MTRFNAIGVNQTLLAAGFSHVISLINRTRLQARVRTLWFNQSGPSERLLAATGVVQVLALPYC